MIYLKRGWRSGTAAAADVEDVLLLEQRLKSGKNKRKKHLFSQQQQCLRLLQCHSDSEQGFDRNINAAAAFDVAVEALL